jgi:F-type H+-transporting ATPase subunit a
MDPVHQFEITNYFVFGRIGGVELAFTKSALYMLIALAIIAWIMVVTTSARAPVPGRLQGVAEMSYEFIASSLQSTAGPEGMKFFRSS